MNVWVRSMSPSDLSDLEQTDAAVSKRSRKAKAPRMVRPREVTLPNGFELH